MKLNKLALVPLMTLLHIGKSHASACVNYNLSAQVVKKISSAFLATTTKPYSFSSANEGILVNQQDTIIYSKDKKSAVGYSAENNDCDLSYVHFEHDTTRFKEKNTTCNSVIKNTLAIISENHSLLKEAAKSKELKWKKTASESGALMTNSHGKRIGKYDYLDASFYANVDDKKIKVSFETYKTRQTCFLYSVNVTQE